jgi:hypothetical protein
MRGDKATTCTSFFHYEVEIWQLGNGINQISKLVQTVMLLASIPKILCSNIAWDTDYLTGFLWYITVATQVSILYLLRF